MWSIGDEPVLFSYHFSGGDELEVKGILCLSRKSIRRYRSSATRILGDYSFGICLSHIAVMIVMNHVPGYQRIPYVANSVLMLAISFFCCVIGDRRFRKIKIGGTNLSQVLGLK